MSSSFSRLRRRSRESNRSNDSDSDGNSIRVSPSRHNDKVTEVERSENENKDSGPDLAQTTPQVGSSQPHQATPTPPQQPQETEGTSARSNRSNRDSDRDPIRVSPSRHEDGVAEVKILENEHKNSVPGLAQTTPKIENSQPHQAAPTHPQQPQETETNMIPVDATVARNQNQRKVRQSPPKDKETSPNTEDKVHRVKIESDRTGWGRISDLIRQYDRDRVEDVKEDIDTLLVFAGLFSAVITAFIIESYKTLQQQPEDTTNQILLQLSAQIASLTVSGNLVNSTMPAFTTPSFIPMRFSVLINTLWLLSLIFALVTASLGILVKQWLHELMARDTQDPRQQVKLRFFREVGVQRWQIFEIASALPLLLQLALLLFFIGLSAFLHDLNPVVTWIVTGFMILWLIFYLFTTFAPAFSSQCPYKTPMLKGILQRIRVGNHTWLKSLARTLHTNIPDAWPTIKQRCKDLHDWLDTWLDAWMACEETKARESDTWDLPTLVCLREILRGEQLEETITDCVRKCGVKPLLRCMRLFSRDEDPVNQGILPDVPQGLTHQTCELFASRISDLSLSFAPWFLADLYLRMTYALSEAYVPATNFPVPRGSLPVFIRLINKDRNSAVYSVLTMYSVRHHTLESHPGHFDNLFPYIFDDERQTYGIGTRFVSNLVAATRAICCHLWNQSHVDSDLDMDDILWPISQIRSDSDPDIPTDPIAFISTFTEVLYLAPQGVRQKCRHILVEVMGELANILTVADGPSYRLSRKACVERIYRCLFEIYLRDTPFVPKLGDLIRTWWPNFDHTKHLSLQLTHTTP
ncbi:hypothetical protein QCA50_007921 [Cerrena zonata]|uniref:DUF6535 domain-containing protein n=1 Tax=Cerrena zonata TaxID=2478898 RepID=A0AAW0GJL9_9APHY